MVVALLLLLLMQVGFCVPTLQRVLAAHCRRNCASCKMGHASGAQIFDKPEMVAREMLKGPFHRPECSPECNDSGIISATLVLLHVTKFQAKWALVVGMDKRPSCMLRVINEHHRAQSQNHP